MTLYQMRQTAWAKFLFSQPTVEVAAEHVMDCLRDGQSDSMAWELMKLVHGERWRFALEILPRAVVMAVEELHAATEEMDPDEYDDSKDIKAGNNQACRAHLELLCDWADEQRKRDKGE